MLDESKLLSGEKLPLMDRAKLLIYKTLQKHAFIAIFLLASVCISYCLILDSLQIPNPLFDLAGFLCGHFLVPFGVFFGAAFLGKAVVKVSIQSFFVIFCFSQHQVDIILQILQSINPKLQALAMSGIEKQKKTLFSEVIAEESRPLIAVIWEYFVMAMIIYFIYSIISSLVQNYLQEQDEEEKQGQSNHKDKSKNSNNNKKIQ